MNITMTSQYESLAIVKLTSKKTKKLFNMKQMSTVNGLKQIMLMNRYVYATEMIIVNIL